MIKTHEELLKLHGRKVTCEIKGIKIEDAKIAVEEDYVFVCQNEKDGLNADDKLGYDYSLPISREDWKYEDRDYRLCTNITLVNDGGYSEELFYRKFHIRKPTLITIQKEIKKYTDDDTTYSKDSITFDDTEYSISEWKEYVERVRRVNKRFNSLSK